MMLSRLLQEATIVCFSRVMAVYGAWVTILTANWVQEFFTYRPTGLRRLWPATSRRLPQVVTSACFLRVMAVYGPWATIAPESLAMAPTIALTSPNRLWPVTSLQ